jgi:hypothetical protein
MKRTNNLEVWITTTKQTVHYLLEVNKLSEIPIDPVTDTSQVTSGIHGSGPSRGPFLPNAEEVTRGHQQLAGERNTYCSPSSTRIHQL